MQQYRVEFFESFISDTTSTRKLKYVFHDFINDLPIDDDYIAIQTTTIEIKPTDKVKNGHFIRILRDNDDYFFGYVVDAEPGTYTTKISFKPFLAVFDTDILFNVLCQYRSAENPGITLEETLQGYIDAYFASNSDYRQCYPMTITIPAAGSRTVMWNMGITSDEEGSSYAVVGLYQTLIVRAMKEYGVAIEVTPNFSTGVIALSIGKVSGTFHIDAGLDNVTVKTFKVNDRPVTPDGTYEDPDDDFMYAALATAYDELSGLEFDNLIELECAPNDRLISPTTIKNGQKVTIHYKGEAYTSILTGKSVSFEVITLMFGSERITYTKKTSK